MHKNLYKIPRAPFVIVTALFFFWQSLPIQVVHAAALSPTSVTMLDLNTNGQVERLRVAFTDVTACDYEDGDWTITSGGSGNISMTDVTGIANTATCTTDEYIDVLVDAAYGITSIFSLTAIDYTDTGTAGSIAADGNLDSATFTAPIGIGDGAGPWASSFTLSDVSSTQIKIRITGGDFDKFVATNSGAYTTDGTVLAGFTYKGSNPVSAEVIDFNNIDTIWDIADVGTGHTGTPLTILAGILKDAAGVENLEDATNSFIVDNAKPFVISATYGDDVFFEGQIDRVTVVYTEPVNDPDYNALDVPGYTVPGTGTGTGTDTLIYDLSEQSIPDTGITLSLNWTGANAADLNANDLDITGAPASAADGAAPVILDRAYAFRNAANSANTIQYTFSENTLWNTGSPSQFAISNNDLTGFDDDGEPYAFVSGSGSTILQLATYGTTDLTGTNGGTEPTVSYTQSVTTADRLQDAAGNYVVSEGLMSLTDRQGPTTVGWRTYTDDGNDGSVDQIALDFTENVTWNGSDLSQWSIDNNSLTSFSADSNTVDIGYLQPSGASGSLTNTPALALTTSGTTDLTGVGAGTQPILGYHQSATPANRVKDGAGNDMYDETGIWATMADGAAPVLAEVAAVSTPTSDSTPGYSFSSSEGGAITYSGGCQSVPSTATVGTNPVVLDSDGAGTPLYYGIYYCFVTVTDTATNASSALQMTSFTIGEDANADLTLGSNATVGLSDNTILTLTVPINLDDGDTISFDAPANLDASGAAFSSTTFTGTGFYGCSASGQTVTCTVDTDLTAGTGDIVLSGITARYSAADQLLVNVAVYDTSAGVNVAASFAAGSVTDTVAADPAASVVLSSPTVGAVGDTTLTLTTPFALDADDKISINFPSYMDISGVASAVTGTFENSNEITCTPSGQNLYCTVISGPTLSTGTIIMTGITSRYAGTTDIVALEIENEGVSANYIAVDTDVPLTDVNVYDASASVVLASPTVGAAGDITLTLSVPFALGQDDTIDITFPAYMNVSGVASAVTGTFENGNEITCAATGQTVTCTVISGPTLTTGTIIMTGITSYYAGTANISSLEVEDDGNAAKDIATDTAVALTDVTPADASASVVLASPTVGPAGDTTLTLTTPFPLDADDQIVITFPSYMDLSQSGNDAGTFEIADSIGSCGFIGQVVVCTANAATNSTGTIIIQQITSSYVGTANIISVNVEDEGDSDNLIASDTSVTLTDVTEADANASLTLGANATVGTADNTTFTLTIPVGLDDGDTIAFTAPANLDVSDADISLDTFGGGGFSGLSKIGQVITCTVSTNLPAGTGNIVFSGITALNAATAQVLTDVLVYDTSASANIAADAAGSVTDTIAAPPPTPPPVVTGGGGGAGGSNKNTSSTSDSTTSSKAFIISGSATGKQSYAGPVQLTSGSLKANADGTKSGVLTKEGTITIKPNSKSKISVAIPSNTTVTGNSKWDGKIQPPLIQSVTKIKSTDPKVAQKVVAAVIKVGSLSSPLTFSNSVTLSIPVNLPEGTPVTILFSGDANSWESYGTGIVVNGQVVFQTNHMSYFAITSESGQEAFADIAGHWAKTYIDELTAKGVVSGKSSTAFAPDDSITRAELSKIAVNAFGLTLDETVSETPFEDVAVDSWYAPYISAAKNAGIIEGYEDGRVFSPNASINRAEALKILLTAAKFIDIDESFAEKYTSHADYTYAVFKDTPINAWFAKYVAYSTDKDIVSGYEDQTFRPGNSITRAEVAKIVVKILEMQGN